MKLKRLEKDIERDILIHLKQLPWLKVWKVETQGQFDPKRGVFRKKSKLFQTLGTPDLQGYVCLKRPIPLYIEVKSATGKLSPEQAEFLAQAKLDGCIAFVARSVDDVIKHLNAAMNRVKD